MLDKAVSQFKENIERIRNLHVIHNHLNMTTTNAIDVSDILRTEIVLAVSAFDYYIHEVVRICMLEVYQGMRNQTQAFKKYDISLESVRIAVSNPQSFDWLENEIIDRHSWRSFQQAEKVAEAIRLISDVNLWNTVADRMGKDSNNLKNQLNIIVERRNKIAHEADIDPSYPGSRWPITENMVEEAISFIEELVKTINDIITI